MRAAAFEVILPGLALGMSLVAPGLEAAAPAVVGERLRYAMEMKVETRAEMALPGEAWSNAGQATWLRFNLVWTLETLAVEPDGSARLRARIERFVVASPSANLPADDYEGKALNYTRRPNGGIVDVSAPPEWLNNGKLPAWLRAWFTQATEGTGRPLAEHGPGEAWFAEQVLRPPGLPPLLVKRQSTYLRNESRNAQPCATVLVRFSLATAGPREQALEDRARVVSDVRGGGESLNCYHLDSGRLLESTHASREDVLLQVERREQGRAPIRMTFRTQTTVESHLRLVE